MTSASDLTAKLLAQENLMVHRGAVRTASFDLKNRVLVLPNWRDMSKECEDLMIGHEVGHALYTDAVCSGKSIHEAAEEAGIPFGYINIIEDARIERMVKDKYPGIRKSFFTGYRELWEKGFFGVGSDNVNTYSLIDRINLYFKVGIYAGVKFNEAEKALVKRIESTNSIDEVFAIAKEVLELAKKQFETAKQKYDELDLEAKDGEEHEADFDADLDYGDDFDYDEEDDPDLKPGNVAGKRDNPNQKNDQFKPEDTIRTQSHFDKKMEELADTTLEFVNVTLQPLTESQLNEFVVSYKTIADRVKQYPFTPTHRYNEDSLAKSIKDFESYVVQSNRVVNYLVKEFELKKSADIYRRARKAKRGQLDVSKLYNYKFAEDIFKRVTVLPIGKNHGMVMLVDWSGSMCDQANDTIKQIYSLVTFCKRVNIPFRVYAFSTEWQDTTNDSSYDEKLLSDMKHRQRTKAYLNSLKADALVLNREFSLLEFFSNEMKVNEINEMAKQLFCMTHQSESNYGYIWVPGMGMGGTPLNESLAWASTYLRLFKAKYLVDRLSFIVISDGAGSPLSQSMVQTSDGLRVGSFRHYGKTRYTLTSEITQKSYEFNTEDTIEQTNAMISHIKDVGVDTVGIFLHRKTVRGARAALETFVYRNREARKDRNAIETHAMNMLRDMKDHDVALIPNTSFGKLFLVPVTSIKPIDDIEVDSTTSAKSVASKFSKFMTRQRTSKVFLDKFVEEIA